MLFFLLNICHLICGFAEAYQTVIFSFFSLKEDDEFKEIQQQKKKAFSFVWSQHKPFILSFWLVFA